MKYKVGFIGIGLMGHGIAKNILQGGHRLEFLEHAGNVATDDLLELGAGVASRSADIARNNDAIFICVTGSPQVTDIVFGKQGVLAGIGKGKIVVDCSTIDPLTSTEVADALAKRQAHYLDAPLTRTPKEAEEGRVNIMVGGDRATFRQIEPLLQTFAENIYFIGPAGAGHTMKLLHNYISMGNLALLAEATVCARRSGVTMDTFFDILTSGGGDSTALRRLKPYVLNKDDGALKFSLANGHKDVGYYRRMAKMLGVPTAAQGVLDLFALALEQNAGGRPVPHLVDILFGDDGSA